MTPGSAVPFGSAQHHPFGGSEGEEKLEWLPAGPGTRRKRGGGLVPAQPPPGPVCALLRPAAAGRPVEGSPVSVWRAG